MNVQEKQWIQQYFDISKENYKYKEISNTPLGKVVLIDSANTSFYFKTDTLLVCEAIKTAHITHLLPTVTPELVASCSKKNWLLTKHAGTEVLYSSRQDDWLKALTTLASIHKQSNKTIDSAIFPKHTLNEHSLSEFLAHSEYLDYWEISLQERQLLQRIAEELKPTIKQINQLVTHPCLCHGDAHAKNVLVNDDGIIVWFDWREAYLGNPLADLGFFLWWLSVDRTNMGIVATEQFLSELVSAYEKTFFNENSHALKIPLSVKNLMCIGLASRAIQYHHIYYSVKSFKPYYVTYVLKELIKLNNNSSK